ncbi:hK97 family phage portal protein [Firmicutes bacterium CAG:145]|nr:hK97 family phage portal protein [Firmicutes bacterium CAG:145]
MPKKKSRAEPQEMKKRGVTGFYIGKDFEEDLKCRGYVSLSHSPEIVAGVDKIAELIGSMTIHLMENKDNGDVRVKNGLSRKIDINPYSNGTRSQLIKWIVKTMFLEGEGNAVIYPVTRNGYLKDLRPIPASFVSFVPDGMWDYTVMINGEEFDPEEVLHFTLNPDEYYPWKGRGHGATISNVANNLKQAQATEKGFMESKWKPSIIVKVDGLIDEFSSKEGRKKLLSEYIDTSEAGEPWIIPADQFAIEQVKPLTLSDLALAEFVEIDKKTVASILGVPPFILGVGNFERDSWNNFIATKIMSIAQNIEQELTKKLTYNPNWFFKFNPRSLYNYSISDMARVADDQYIRGIFTGNEVRDWIGMPPVEGLDELVILENYIPRGMIGEQNKLKGGEEI